MSSILLTKDYERPDGTKSKKGEVISVPFVAGKQLIADGIGVYPSQKDGPKPRAVDPEKEAMAKEIGRLKALDLQRQVEVLDLQKQVETLTAPPKK